MQTQERGAFNFPSGAVGSKVSEVLWREKEYT